MMRRLLMICAAAVIFAGLYQNAPLADSEDNVMDGLKRATLLVYDTPEGGDFIWTGTTDGSLPPLKLVGGYIHNIEQVLPGYIKDRSELWIEIRIDGHRSSEERIRYMSSSTTGLRREIAPGSTAETTEDMDLDLNIGETGGVAHVLSDMGIGTTTPEASLDVNGDMILEDGVAVNKILDEDNMASNDATALATQQSIKAYVDSAAVGGGVSEAVYSVSSEDNRIGRYGHMMFVPSEGTEVTESDPAHNDTIYIAIKQEGASGCDTAPDPPGTVYGPSTVCEMADNIGYSVPPSECATYYIWDLPTGSYITDGSGTNSVRVNFGSAPGDILVYAYNSIGTSAASSRTITMNYPPSMPGSITGATSVCSGATGSYSITAVSGATSYSWILPEGTFIASGYGTNAVDITFGNSSGNICVSASNSCGDSDPNCIPVTVFRSLTGDTPGAITGASTVCFGSTGVPYSISAVDGATSYNWTLPSGATITSGAGTNSITVDFGTATSGNISVTAENICGSSDPRSLSVTVNPTTEGGIISGATEICLGDNTGTLTLSGYTGTILDWESRIGSGAWGEIGVTEATYAHVPDAAAVWQYRALVQSGVCTSEYSAVHSITVYPVSVGGSLSASLSSICEGENTGTITLSSYTGTIVKWQRRKDGGSWSDIAHTGATYSEILDIDGVYDYRVEIQSGVCSYTYSSTHTVTVNESPVITNHPSAQSVDEGDPASFSVTATGSALTYQWQENTSAIWTDITGATSTTYTISTTTGSQDGNLYRCVVSGVCPPSVTSNQAELTVSTELYTFTSHTFTNCSATGHTGPTLSACRSAYSTSWDDTYLNMTTQGIQEWTVPSTGTYRITCVGAEGSNSTAGGNGAIMRGDFALTQGTVLKIAVGQRGACSSYHCSGGGGSWVIQGSTPLIVAGGGGGSGDDGNGCDATITTTSNSCSSNSNPTSTGGAGGTSGGDWGGAGGGGFNSDGAEGRESGSYVSGGRGRSWGNGLIGGYRTSGSYGTYVSGGFGGGGAPTWAPGGGGGYSGGAGRYSTGSGSDHAYGGGGASYNTGTSQANSVGNTGNGYVIVEKL